MITAPHPQTLAVLALAGLLLAALGACSNDPGPAPLAAECVDDGACPPGERCVEGRCDAALDTEPEPEPEPEAPPLDFCGPCQRDEDCGPRPQDRCSTLLDGRFCTRDCDTDNTPCPLGAQCQLVGEALQCAPAIGQCTPCFDPDGDGFGEGPECEGPDCAPDDRDRHPGAEEPCDGLDNDCDGDTDEDFDLQGSLTHCGGCGARCAPPDAAEAACVEGQCTVVRCADDLGDCDGNARNGCEARLSLFFLDADGDGFGRGDITSRACRAPDRHVAVVGDCDDGDARRNPRAAEVCDGIDNDCDGDTDEDAGPPLAERQEGVCQGATQVCAGPGGDFVEPDYSLIPAYEAVEAACDGLDNDCDGQTDEGCDPCTVPLFFDTVQEAADARCQVVLLQPGAPASFSIVNPPEALTVRPDPSHPEGGRFVGAALTVQLDRGQPRTLRLERLELEQLTVQSIDQLGAVTLDRLLVRGVEGLSSPVTLSGFNITVQDSLFEGNRVTGRDGLGGAMLVTLAPNFRLIRNTFRDNRATHPDPDRVAGAIFIDQQQTTALMSGNLFEDNRADAADGAGAIVFAAGAGQIEVRNNTFLGNANARNIQASAIQCGAALIDSRLSSNIFWLGTGRHVEGCDAPVTYSNHENGAPEGEGNISADPLLDGSARLSPDSPCRNTGDPSPAFDDLDATRNDMGHTGGPLGQP